MGDWKYAKSYLDGMHLGDRVGRQFGPWGQIAAAWLLQLPAVRGEIGNKAAEAMGIALVVKAVPKLVNLGEITRAALGGRESDMAWEHDAADWLEGVARLYDRLAEGYVDWTIEAVKVRLKIPLEFRHTAPRRRVTPRRLPGKPLSRLLQEERNEAG